MKIKLSKNQVSNLVWILAIVLILFTPIGFYTKVFVGKIFASDATVIKSENRKVLRSYDWQLSDIEGNRINFSKLEGKVVLVNFWATWCPPCIAEMPSLNDLYKDFGDKVAFVFVANDRKEKVIAFLTKEKYDLPVYFETSKTPEPLVSKSIPATFILNKSGKLVVEEKGVANWNSKSTRDLLNQLLQE